MHQADLAEDRARARRAGDDQVDGQAPGPPVLLAADPAAAAPPRTWSSGTAVQRATSGSAQAAARAAASSRRRRPTGRRPMLRGGGGRRRAAATGSGEATRRRLGDAHARRRRHRSAGLRPQLVGHPGQHAVDELVGVVGGVALGQLDGLGDAGADRARRSGPARRCRAAAAPGRWRACARAVHPTENRPMQLVDLVEVVAHARPPARRRRARAARAGRR